MVADLSSIRSRVKVQSSTGGNHHMPEAVKADPGQRLAFTQVVKL
jgi:hypothetical protein